MSVYPLFPACKDYLWGGHRRLRENFGIESSLEPLAEAWVLSCHPDGSSRLADGTTLPELIQREGKVILGENCQHFEEFPLLVKLIDAQQSLSIQVHPSDEYALAHEGQYGKTEMWIVLDADKDAFIYYGFDHEISREEFSRRIGDKTLTQVLHKASAKKDDVFFIPSGTLHAIGAGLVIAEIQQNSNVTYRVFDYDRRGPDGKPRALHVEKALEVTDRKPVSPVDFSPHLGKCPFFTTDRYEGSFSLRCGPDSFHALLVTRGEGELRCGKEDFPIKAGGCFFLTAGSGEYEVNGDCQTLVIYVS